MVPHLIQGSLIKRRNSQKFSRVGLNEVEANDSAHSQEERKLSPYPISLNYNVSLDEKLRLSSHPDSLDAP